MSIIDIALYQSDPERFYRKAWQELNRQNYAAARDLDHIEGWRRSLASREEALFWAAKAYELAGDRQAAKRHYQKLTDQYTGYWVPESLYTLARLQRLDSCPDAALSLEQRLRTDYPEHRLTHALDLQ
ncbi:MAG: tetratricopeptide repeat protein [Methylococcales bacterium]|nr:tetratricopeptide repeat protein [Methylococcales bacterium]